MDSELDYDAALKESWDKWISARPQISWWQRVTYLNTRRPVWGHHDAITAYFDRYEEMLANGRLTWASVVQANELMFERGSYNCPGDVVYVRDPDHAVDVDELCSLAQEIFALKGTDQSDKRLRRIAKHITNEMKRVYGLRIPKTLSPELPCALSTIYFNRRHLPGKVLSGGVCPILLLDDEPQTVMVLPSRFWSEKLIEEW